MPQAVRFYDACATSRAGAFHHQFQFTGRAPGRTSTLLVPARNFQSTASRVDSGASGLLSADVGKDRRLLARVRPIYRVDPGACTGSALRGLHTHGPEVFFKKNASYAGPERVERGVFDETCDAITSDSTEMPRLQLWECAGSPAVSGDAMPTA